MLKEKPGDPTYERLKQAPGMGRAQAVMVKALEDQAALAAVSHEGTRQLLAAIATLGRRVAETVIAYEPVWAIGTGKTATADQVQKRR